MSPSTSVAAASEVYPDRRRWRRWRRTGAIVLLIAAVIGGGGWWLNRRAGSVEVVAPGALVVEMDDSDFASAYYTLLQQNDWRVVRESSLGYPGGKAKTRLGRSERAFRMTDGMEVNVDATLDGDRHIVFLSFRPTGGAPSNDEMRRRSEEITNLLADAWRAEAKKSKWDRLQKMFP